jgi:hypothetical protein
MAVSGPTRDCMKAARMFVKSKTAGNDGGSA